MFLFQINKHLSFYRFKKRSRGSIGCEACGVKYVNFLLTKKNNILGFSSIDIKDYRKNTTNI